MVLPAAIFENADAFQSFRHFLYRNKVLKQHEILVIHLVG